MRLYDIVEFSKRAIEIAGSHHRVDLDTNEVLRLALVHLIQMIGEAAGKLPKSFRQGHPQIPWPAIISMRNRIVHEYWQIDSEIVWDVVQHDLPRIVDQFTPLLAEALAVRRT